MPSECCHHFCGLSFQHRYSDLGPIKHCWSLHGQCSGPGWHGHNMHVLHYELWHCNASVRTEIQCQCNSVSSRLQFKTQWTDLHQHRSEIQAIVKKLLNKATLIAVFSSIAPVFWLYSYVHFLHQLPVSQRGSPSWWTAPKMKPVCHGMPVRGQCTTVSLLQADTITVLPVIALVATPAFWRVSPVGQHTRSRWWLLEMSARVHRVRQWTLVQV